MFRTFVKWTFGTLILAAMIVGVGLWQMNARDALRRWDPAKARAQGRPIPVRTVAVQEGQAGRYVGSTAATVPSRTVSLTVSPGNSEITVRKLNAVYVSQGAPVRHDEVLFEFDSQLFALTVAERQSALAKAETDLKSFEQLYAKNATSELELTEARLNVQTAQLQLAVAENDLRDCTIRSPISGVADEVKVTPGVRLNSATSLVDIHQLNPIHVKVDFPIERLDSLRLKQSAEVVLDSFPQETFEGSVIRISPVASTRTRVLAVIVEVPNPGNRIRAGISGFVRIATGCRRGIAIPQMAVIAKDQKSMVFTMRKDRVHIREIETGDVTPDGQIEVLSGLQPGEEVVTFGQASLRDNDLVDPDWRSWARR